MIMKLRLGVLVSGRGSNLQAVMDAIAAGTLDALVAVVVSDKPDAPALRRIENSVPPKVYSGGEPELIEGDVFKTIIPIGDSP
jgi:folate-dependent phosphoribosylglycinamide formyltransferase PurN